MTTEHQNFENRVKASLDASVDLIDKKSREDLAAIRRKALSKTQPSAPWLNFNIWVPAGALAFCALFTVLLLYHPLLDDVPHHLAQENLKAEQSDQLAMLELLTNSEDAEIASDPGFYVWLDEVLENGGTNDAV